MMRYARAFVETIRLALRGELIEPSPLESWLAGAADQVEAINKAASAHGISPSQLKLRIDRREISMKTIVDTVQFHVTQEYPHLYQHFQNESLTMIRANNLDDHFRVTRLADAPEIQSTPLQITVSKLAAHLENMPPA
jgi:hypothetical protein